MRLIIALLIVAGAACEPDPGGGGDSWEWVARDLPEGLVDVWGTGAGDVFAVGGDVGAGPIALRWDGAGWTRLDTGAATGTLRGVSGSASRVWMVGEGGTVLRGDRGAGPPTAVGGVPPGVTLNAVSEAGGAVWAVGGDGAVGRIYRLSGASFVEDTSVAAAARGVALNDVWAEGADEVWAVGRAGVILHRSGGVWSTLATPGGKALQAVHARAGAAVAVGGSISALVVEASADTATNVSPPQVKALLGVVVRADGGVVAVGGEGTVVEREGTVWRTPDGVPATLDDHAAVYVDPSGGVWVVGGNLVSDPPRDGALLHFGGTIARYP